MIKKKSLSVILIVFSLLIISCNKNDKFKIEKGKVGLISTVTTIKDLETIFNNDSLVKNLSEGALGNNYFQDDDEILVFEKGGKHLLTIIPKDQLDSTSTIRSIEIHDNRFKTEVGLSLSSNFSEINANDHCNVIKKHFISLPKKKLNNYFFF